MSSEKDSPAVAGAKRGYLALSATPTFAEGKETCLADLLADLRHYAAANEIDFDEVLARSETYVEADMEGVEG